MITGLAFSTASLSVDYPVGLPANQYISGSQLNTDFQGFVTAYPNPSDPTEAILGSVLQSILNKYPQMTGGTLSGQIGGSTFMGIPIPGNGGSVYVTIGTYSLTGLFGGTSTGGAAANPAPAVKSANSR